MRDYGKVSGRFWTAGTGKGLRGDLAAQLVAVYLMTSPHANMIGVFTCPVLYIAHETGLTIEGAGKALERLIDEGFCTFDEASEVIWVHEMAKFQIGDQLDPKDKQVKGVQKQYESIAENRIKQGFFARYRDAFHLTEHKPHTSPSEAPSKPGTGAGTGEGTEAGKGGADAPTGEPDFLLPPPAKAYHWSGKVVHLAEPDYANWRKAYSAIPDFDAELFAADCYYSEHPLADGKWFFPVSNWLKKAHNEAKTKAKTKPPKGVIPMHPGAGG